MFLLLVGCPWIGSEKYDVEVRDADGDGVVDMRFGGPDCQDFDGTVGDCDADLDGEKRMPFGPDCDDADRDVNSGAPEICDGIDNDCDGLVDDQDDVADLYLNSFFADDDNDGAGGFEVRACAAPSGTFPPSVLATDRADCDDADPSISPLLVETCEPVDRNCDGSLFAGVPDAPLWSTDGDGDGYGPENVGVVESCEQPAGLAPATDCDDSRPEVSPGQPESCNGYDDDCDGLIDDDDDLDVERIWALDEDQDNAGAVGTAVESCTSPGPEYREVPATDCDDGDPAVTGQFRVYLDEDGDGFGVAGLAGEEVFACTLPQGFADRPGDCDDQAFSINPNIVEACNAVDDDCNGLIDDGLEFLDYYVDADQDGYGDNAGEGIPSCDVVAGRVSRQGDCDDARVQVNPLAVEACNGRDDDCDEEVDNGLEFLNYYVDADQDGFGDDALAAVSSCSLVAGRVTRAGDCDDTTAQVSPIAAEVCNGEDEDCDGVSDNGLEFLDYYPDQDGDGFGVRDAVSASLCAPGAGLSLNDSDCDDSNVFISPAGVEICDGLDNNCNGVEDENAGDFAYADVDEDGVGAGPLISGTQNSPADRYCIAPPGLSLIDGDCDDDDERRSPLELEICDGVDNDCDDQIDDDDDDTLQTRVFYRDDDLDGAGDSLVSLAACMAPDGFVSSPGDCDDQDAATSPFAPEICNGRDDNCNSQVDENAGLPLWPDEDQDGFGDSSATPVVGCTIGDQQASNPLDCNDDDPAISPAGVETCVTSRIDEDCDGLVDDADPSVVKNTFYFDGDQDGFGRFDAQRQTCDAAVPNYSAMFGDCDDLDPSVRLAATDLAESELSLQEIVDLTCEGGVVFIAPPAGRLDLPPVVIPRSMSIYGPFDAPAEVRATGTDTWMTVTPDASVELLGLDILAVDGLDRLLGVQQDGSLLVSGVQISGGRASSVIELGNGASLEMFQSRFDEVGGDPSATRPSVVRAGRFSSVTMESIAVVGGTDWTHFLDLDSGSVVRLTDSTVDGLDTPGALLEVASGAAEVLVVGNRFRNTQGLLRSRSDALLFGNLLENVRALDSANDTAIGMIGGILSMQGNTLVASGGVELFDAPRANFVQFSNNAVIDPVGPTISGGDFDEPDCGLLFGGSVERYPVRVSDNLFIGTPATGSIQIIGTGDRPATFGFEGNLISGCSGDCRADSVPELVSGGSLFPQCDSQVGDNRYDADAAAQLVRTASPALAYPIAIGSGPGMTFDSSVLIDGGVVVGPGGDGGRGEAWQTDSDADGVPDGWERFFYDSLTCTDSRVPYDHKETPVGFTWARLTCD